MGNDGGSRDTGCISIYNIKPLKFVYMYSKNEDKGINDPQGTVELKCLVILINDLIIQTYFRIIEIYFI